MLYKRYYGFAMSLCLRYVRNREDALEVMNDAFMKVFSHIKTFKQECSFKSWFRRVLVNTALDHYKSRGRYQLSQEWDETMSGKVAGESDVGQISADEILELFSLLPDQYRITFNLFEVEGYNHEEIAGMMDISPGTSRSNLSRAKHMLRYHYNKLKDKQRDEAV